MKKRYLLYALQQAASLSTQPTRPPDLKFRHTVKAPFAKVVNFYERDDILEILTPPVIRLRTLKKEPINEQSINAFTLAPPLIGVPEIKWVARHQDIVRRSEVFAFCDIQEEGPMKQWMHTHDIRPTTTERSVVVDSLWLEYPQANTFEGVATRLLFGGPALSILFAFRAAITRFYLEVLLKDSS